MSRLRFLALAAFAGSVLSVSAHADPDAEGPAKVERYQLKNRSYFRTSQTSRTPFWPIGYVKANQTTEAPAAPAPVTKLSPEMFAVTSILLGNPSLAVINGRAYGEGEYLRPARAIAQTAAAGSGANRVRVVRILDGMVTLQSADGQSLVVPLRRAVLNERRTNAAEEELPDAP